MKKENMKNFALIGASGYIAPRHMKAIKETGNNLVVAMDTYDGIGIMDSNFPQADFFTEFERFSAFVDSFKRDGNTIDYMAITTPNYLHDSHIRFALKSGSNAICEKPLVLNPKQIDDLNERVMYEIMTDVIENAKFSYKFKNTNFEEFIPIPLPKRAGIKGKRVYSSLYG